MGLSSASAAIWGPRLAPRATFARRGQTRCQDRPGAGWKARSPTAPPGPGPARAPGPGPPRPGADARLFLLPWCFPLDVIYSVCFSVPRPWRTESALDPVAREAARAGASHKRPSAPSPPCWRGANGPDYRVLLHPVGQARGQVGGGGRLSPEREPQPRCCAFSRSPGPSIGRLRPLGVTGCARPRGQCVVGPRAGVGHSKERCSGDPLGILCLLASL